MATPCLHPGDPIQWGRRLIKTEDHDPLYSSLVRWSADAGANRLMRFMLTYWCCYSVGASWYISQYDGSTYWDTLQCAAQNEIPAPPTGGRWPRAHERRHWRGQKAIDSVVSLRRRFDFPEDAIHYLSAESTLKGMELFVTEWPQFGPWIAFKAADMLERVLGQQITFPNSVITLYRDPRKGAELAAAFYGLPSAQAAAELLLDNLQTLTAPGARPRPVNIQEVETVLCKWKSAVNGKYRLGLDIEDHRAELRQWGAHDLLAAYPSLVD